MANSPNPTVQNIVPMHELNRSDAEKAVARRAFYLALRKELEALIRDAKGRAAKIEEPSELWGLESWLTKRRREIDRRYDYRYSVLPLVASPNARHSAASFHRRRRRRRIVFPSMRLRRVCRAELDRLVARRTRKTHPCRRARSCASPVVRGPHALHNSHVL